MPKSGLLRRGACHWARIRATRWLLAMTPLNRLFSLYGARLHASRTIRATDAASPIDLPGGRTDLPDGHACKKAVESPLQKYSGSLPSQITSTSRASRPNTEGRFAIVTNVGLGMRWTRVALLTK